MTTIPVYDLNIKDSNLPLLRYIPLNTSSDYDISSPHRHNYYEIFFFTKGGGSHLIDFKEYSIDDLSIHFLAPGQVHRMNRAPDSRGNIVLFSPDLYHLGSENNQTLFRFPFLSPGHFPVLQMTAEGYQDFKIILGEIEKETNDDIILYPEMIRSLLHVLLLRCLRSYELSHPDKPAKPPTLFNELQLLVETDYRLEKLPVYYADKLNITEKKLNSLCKEVCGINVSDFIKRRVILEAKRLLFNSDHSVKEIACFLGFEDASYFNRYFKADAKISAGDFRKTWQKLP